MKDSDYNKESAQVYPLKQIEVLLAGISAQMSKTALHLNKAAEDYAQAASKLGNLN